MNSKLASSAQAAALLLMAATITISARNAAAESTSTLAAATSATRAQAPATSATTSIYAIPIDPMDVEGATSATSLAAYKGKVLLIVNVASKCGFTKQYKGLQELYDKHKNEGLVVLGFPSNDFNDQEPGSEEEIVEFCTGRFGVSFPLFGKIEVTGEHKAPLYKYLTEGDHPGKGEVTWNFNKFLVDREGHVVNHFESKVTPEDPALVAQIKLLLAAKP